MFSRAGTYPISEIMPFVIMKSRAQCKRGIKKQQYRELVTREFNGHPVKMDSLRYQLFFSQGVTCVECGIEGEYFALESNKDTCVNQENPYYHFNLYAVDVNGKEVLMTKDHIIPKSKGGKDQIQNMQVMCYECNQAKGNYS
jgi:5-methylcytosine-specific restriction endonuclease McrA